MEAMRRMGRGRGGEGVGVGGGVAFGKVEIEEAVELGGEGVVDDGVADAETLVDGGEFEGDAKGSEGGGDEKEFVNAGGGDEG